MKRVFITVLLAAIISITAFELNHLLGIDFGLTAGNASATTQYSPIDNSSSVRTMLENGIAAVPLSVDMSVQSADSATLLSVELIALVVVALGLLTAAAIIWDGRHLQD